jgi:hypothetical protein
MTNRRTMTSSGENLVISLDDKGSGHDNISNWTTREFRRHAPNSRNYTYSDYEWPRDCVEPLKKCGMFLLGVPCDSDSYRALFVPSPMGQSFPSFVFTAWERGAKLKHTKNTHAVEKYMSLEVEPVRSTTGQQRLAPTTWINRLCFFESLEKQSFILSWPK